MEKHDARRKPRNVRQSRRRLLDRIADALSPDVDEKPSDSFEGKEVQCFLCGRWTDVRISKKDRPYFVCDACGIQVFVRGNKGIERLKEHVREES